MKNVVLTILLVLSNFIVQAQDLNISNRLKKYIAIEQKLNLQTFTTLHRKPTVVQKQLSQLLPVYDSIYYWHWDTVIVNWETHPHLKMTEFTYDANFNTTGYTFYTWNGNNWVNNWKATRTFDANNNFVLGIYQVWNNGNWENDEKLVSTYDANGNRLSEEYYQWTNNNWEIFFQLSNMYDASNNWLSAAYQNYIGMIWLNSVKYIWTYDANNNMLSESTQWGDTLNWINGDLSTYTYNANNKLISTLYQNWNGNNWVDYFLTTNIYNTSNQLTASLTQAWQNAAWQNGSRQTNTYDINNNCTSNLQETWTNSSWENLYKTDKIYDANNNNIYTIKRFWLNTSWNNYDEDINTINNLNFIEGRSYKHYFVDTNGVVFFGDSTHYYYNSALTIHENEIANDISIYPNPTTHQFQVSSTKYKVVAVNIYNVLGEIVMSKVESQKSKELMIDVSTIMKGVYIIEVATENGIIRKKLIKE